MTTEGESSIPAKIGFPLNKRVPLLGKLVIFIFASALPLSGSLNGKSATAKTYVVSSIAATLPGMDVIGDAATRRNAAMLAFDEPLTKEQVIAIVRGFIKDDAARGLP